MIQFKARLLTDKVFLLGLITLLANDLILKYEIGGFVTGKLSDISGLFIFPFFWGIFFEQHRLKIYILTTVAFIFWKLPISSDAINAINQVLSTKLSRVVDYSDLATLLIIPFSYRYLGKRIENYTQQSLHLTLAPIIISLISLFAFIATSQPRKDVEQKLIINEELICNVSKSEIIKNRLKAGRGSYSLEKNLADTSFRISFHVNKLDARIVTWVKIYSIDSIKSSIEIHSLESYTITGRFGSGIDEDNIESLKNLTREELIELFKSNVIKVIEDKKVIETDIYFDNPKLDHYLDRY